MGKNGLDLRIEYSCLHEHKGTTELTIESPERHTVESLKSNLQELLNAPTSDMHVFLNGQALDEDNTPLQQLYLRENDQLAVNFSARVDIASIRQQVNELRTFSKLAQCFRELDAIDLLNHDHALPDRQAYANVDNAIIKLCGSFCRGFDLDARQANKTFFVQEGGLDLFVEIFKFASKLVLKKGFQKSDETTTEPLYLYNDYQYVLTILCLRLIWNFADTKKNCKLMLDKGVGPLLLKALLLEPNANRYQYTRPSRLPQTISDINQEAVRCFAGLSECNASVQESISKNALVVRKLLLMMNPERKYCTVFTNQLATCVLFHCTFSQPSLDYLVQKGVHYKMMRVLQKLLQDVNGDLILRYYSVLFLARIRSSLPTEDLEQDGAAQTIDILIERFLGRHKPDEIKTSNEELNNCKSLVPYIQLAYAGGKYCVCEQTCQAGENALNYGPRNSCDCHGNGADNSSPMKKNTNQVFIKHSDCCEAAFYEQIDGFILSSSQVNTSCKCIETLPVLRSEIPLWSGSRATQRLGVFALQSLLPTKTNFELLVSENLLPYLVTLGWHLRSPEKTALMDAFSNVKGHAFTPPSLQVIARSMFARRDGLQRPVFCL